MALPKRITARVGDVFRARADDIFLMSAASSANVFGQVLRRDTDTVVVVVFERFDRAGRVLLDEPTSRRVSLAGIIGAEKLANGDWTIVGNQPSVVPVDLAMTVLSIPQPLQIAGHFAFGFVPWVSVA
jgi:hypothetical protein